MQPIDRPFHPRWDFFVVWVFLAAILFALTRQSQLAEIPLAYCAELILVPFFATFLLYGPVLLVRQIRRSGSRGWFVASVFVTVLLAAGLFAAIMFYTGRGGHASLWSGGAAFAAITYLHWRLDEPQA